MPDSKVCKQFNLTAEQVCKVKFLKLGQITIGMQKDWICELELEEGAIDLEKSVNLVKVELLVSKDTDKGQKKVRVQNSYGELALVPKSKAVSSKTKLGVNEEVQTQLLRIQGAQVMKQARKFMFQDKLEEAKSIFDSFESDLSRFKKIDVVIDNLRSDVGKAQHFLGLENR